MSCRAAARRSGVSFQSIRWVGALRERGSTATANGRDTRSSAWRRTRIFFLAFIGTSLTYAQRNLRPSGASASES